MRATELGDDPARAEFAAEGTERVKPGQRLIARDGADPDLWGAPPPRLRPRRRNTKGWMSLSGD